MIVYHVVSAQTIYHQKHHSLSHDIWNKRMKTFIHIHYMKGRGKRKIGCIVIAYGWRAYTKGAIGGCMNQILSIAKLVQVTRYTSCLYTQHKLNCFLVHSTHAGAIAIRDCSPDCFLLHATRLYYMCSSESRLASASPTLLGSLVGANPYQNQWSSRFPCRYSMFWTIHHIMYDHHAQRWYIAISCTRTLTRMSFAISR